MRLKYNACGPLSEEIKAIDRHPNQDRTEMRNVSLQMPTKEEAQRVSFSRIRPEKYNNSHLQRGIREYARASYRLVERGKY